MAELFNFETLFSGLTEREQIAEERRKAQLRDSQVQQEVTKKNVQLTREYQESTDFFRESVADTRRAAMQSRKLSDGSILDKIALAGLQSLEPAKYTAAGRTKRLAEDSQYVSALGQIYNIDKMGLETELLASAANVDKYKLLETISTERLTALKTAADTAKGNFEAAETMKSLAIQGLDPTQIDAAIQQADLSGGKVNIGGVDIDRLTLENRKFNLTEQEHQRTLRGVLRQTELFAAEELLKDQPAKAKANEAQRENVDTEILLRKEELRAQVRKAIQDSQRTELAHKSLEELTSIRGNRYVSKDGEEFNPADVDEMYTRAMTAKSDAITQKVDEFKFGNYDATQLIQEDRRIETLLPRFKTNSPLYHAAQTYRRTLALSSNFVGSDKGPLERRIGMTVLGEAKTAFEEAIDKQVNMDTKDASLKEVYREFYRGNPIPEPELRAVIGERLLANKPIVDVLPPEMVVKVMKEYSVRSQEKKLAGVANLGFDEKIAKQEAANEALDAAINDNIATKSIGLLENQIRFPGHPVATAGVSPAEFGDLMRSADSIAFSLWQKDTGFDEKQSRAILNNQTPEGMSDTEAQQARQMLRDLENQQLLLNLESKQTGLGTQFVRWWQTEGTKYIQTQTMTDRPGTTVADGIVNSLTQSALVNRMGQYGLELYQADGQQKQLQARQFSDLITFGGDAEQSQIVLLDTNQELSSPDKKRIWTQVIAPALAEAKQLNLGFEDANAFVEQKILTAEGADPAAVAAIKTLRRTRSDNLAHLNSIRSWAKWSIGRIINYNDPAQRPSPNYLDWYEGQEKRLHEGVTNKQLR